MIALDKTVSFRFAVISNPNGLSTKLPSLFFDNAAKPSSSKSSLIDAITSVSFPIPLPSPRSDRLLAAKRISPNSWS